MARLALFAIGFAESFVFQIPPDVLQIAPSLESLTVPPVVGAIGGIMGLERLVPGAALGARGPGGKGGGRCFD